MGQLHNGHAWAIVHGCRALVMYYIPVAGGGPLSCIAFTCCGCRALVMFYVPVAGAGPLSCFTYLLRVQGPCHVLRTCSGWRALVMYYVPVAGGGLLSCITYL